MTDMGNPFATEEAWGVDTGAYLGAGDYVCEVLEIIGNGTSSGGYPQLEIKVGCDLGTIRDWQVVLPTSIGKVVQFFDAVGLERPSDAQVAQEGSGYRLDPKYLDQAVGKKVGVVVRDEPKFDDPTKFQARVKGYVKADAITSPGPHAPQAGDFSPAVPAAGGDDYPF